MCLIFILCSGPHNIGILILQRMREQHETDAEDEEDSASDDADDARKYFLFQFNPYRSMSLILLQRRGRDMSKRPLIGSWQMPEPR